LKLSRTSTHARSLPGGLTLIARRQQGFSLVESMVGFLILGITVAALYGGFSFGFNSIKLSQEEVRADQILVQKLETLRIYNWTNIINSSFMATATNFTAYYSTSNAVHGVTYNGTLSISPFVPSATPETYSSSLRQVTASVSWFSEGMNHTRTMMTLVSSNGISTYVP
jgi:prepilin-type N-terminal cleavage/methylation domain-containing protein